MTAAARVLVDLVSPNDDPLADYKLEMSGEELYPSTNIMESTKTNGEGKAEFGDVPLKAFWFSLGGRGELRTEPIKFSKPGEVRYRLTYDDIAGTLTPESQ